MPHYLLLRLQRANELITFYPGRMPWAIVLLGLRLAIARNHDSCNTRYCLYSLDVLPAATEFCEILRHVRVVPCHSVAMMRNITSVSSQQQFSDLHPFKRFQQQCGLNTNRMRKGICLITFHTTLDYEFSSPPWKRTLFFRTSPRHCT